MSLPSSRDDALLSAVLLGRNVARLKGARIWRLPLGKVNQLAFFVKEWGREWGAGEVRKSYAHNGRTPSGGRYDMVIK